MSIKVEQWEIATEELQNKYNHDLLNLNYQIDNVDSTVLTNVLITKTLNELLKFIESQPNKIFVYDYNDDLVSLVGYKILKVLQSQISSFDFKLLKKNKIFNVKSTKKQLTKKQKFISVKKINNQSNKYALISSFNPIYKVIGVEKSFNNFGLRSFNIVEKFTPTDFLNCSVFYNIKIPKNDIFSTELKYINRYNKEINDLNEGQIWTESLNPIHWETINVVYVSGITDEALDALQKVEQSNDVNFYFTDDLDSNGAKVLFSNNYAYLVKRKTNIPSYRYQNINNYNLVKYCRDLGIRLNLVGFTTKKYFEFLNVMKN